MIILRFVTIMVYVSQLAPNIFILRALPITPATSSGETVEVTGGAPGCIKEGDGAGGTAVVPNAPSTAVPHEPQNFVVVLIGAPQREQDIFSGWDAAGEGCAAGWFGVPHIPQNFSIPVTGLPHEAHTGTVTDGGGI